MTDQTLRCPKCWLTDRVHTVASVYASGSSASRIDIRGASQLPLKQMLEPPPRPRKPRAPGVLVALAAAALLIGGISLTVGPGVRSSEFGTSDSGAAATVGRVFAIAGVLALAVGAFVVVLVVRAYGRSQRRFTRQFSVWEREMEVWNRLCYCSRDNGIFLPGQSDFLPPEHLRVFLSRPAGRRTATQVHLRH